MGQSHSAKVHESISNFIEVLNADRSSNLNQHLNNLLAASDDGLLPTKVAHFIILLLSILVIGSMVFFYTNFRNQKERLDAITIFMAERRVN